MEIRSLEGTWTVDITGLSAQPVRIPGTLDESGIGFPDEGGNQWHPENTLGNEAEFLGNKRILTRLTRRVTYEGPAHYRHTFFLDKPAGDARVFLEVERSRELALSMNGRPVPAWVPGTVSTPHVFEVTDCLAVGRNEVSLCCDNSYPTWPHDAIVYSSAATDETQTNWNGLLGYVRLRFEAPQFIAGIRVHPGQNAADVTLEVDCAAPYAGTLRITSPAFQTEQTIHVDLPAGRHEVRFSQVALAPGAKRWDEGEGNLHEVTAEGARLEPVTIRFGLRTFGVRQGRLMLNDRRFFLRSEANCCVFPETGHMPMDQASWKAILTTYASYGINCMRFHSHCPPEAAFAAADEMGMMMQPELSHWNPRTAFEDDRSWAYFPLEMRQILRTYANHPSFVMMTWGNELAAGPLGHARMNQMLEEARALDSTRLYAEGSNNHYGALGADPASDFHTCAGVFAEPMRATSAGMRGYLNESYPAATAQFDAVVATLRAPKGKAGADATTFNGAVFSFEVGQFELLPDFDEWDTHAGVTRPDNFDHIRERVVQAGWMPEWKRRVEATGELSLLGYREEVEAVLRSEALSGISLLGLQDFPGQGTALVGMLNAHLQPKPFAFAQPERFRAFLSDVVPLVLLGKYTYLAAERLQAEVKLANHGKSLLTARGEVRLLDGETLLATQALPEQAVPAGRLASLGTIDLPLPDFLEPRRLDVQVVVGTATCRYPIWVYPDADVTCPPDVLVTASAEEAFQALAAGRKVLLDPPATAEKFPRSIRTQFTTDFWSVGTFAEQEGFMGCLVDPSHPVFAGFPTEFQSNWQWWPMCQGRAMILPPDVKPLVTALDCYARMRHMGLLVEARVGEGRLVVSSMGMQEKRMYPEVRALLQSILNYMASEAFQPELTVGDLAALGV